MNYLLHVLNLICIYLILSHSLNLLVGHTGILSLCHAAFYGLGAYIGTLLSTGLQLPFAICAILAVGGAVAISFTFSMPALRLKGDYIVLASLGFQIIVYNLLNNLISLTNGPYGITNIPSPDVLGVRLDSPLSFLCAYGFAAVLCAVTLHMIGNSPFGRVLRAIREDELATVALGKNVARFKVTAFAIAAGYAAFAGVLLAGYLRYIDPTSFTLMESFFILTLIIIGGAGNTAGPIIGTVLLVVLPEAMQFLRIPDTVGPAIRQVLYGTLIILVVRFRPQGLAGEYHLG